MRVEATFEASNDDGKPYTIHALRDDHDIRSGRGEAQDRLGELRTDDGRFVNYISRGVYEIIDGMDRIRIKSADPNAP